MCGIVGLFLKNKKLEPQLGRHMAAMLGVMSDRGPDSAGFAVYNASGRNKFKLTLRGSNLQNLTAALQKATKVRAEKSPHDNHLVISFPKAAEDKVRGWLAANRPDVTVLGAGQSIEIYKEVGRPEKVAARFGLAKMSGSHGIGHTRMATESAVTTDGAHPFSTGPDQCLVHNGSLSNHYSVRRGLQQKGLSFVTDNDSEVAAGYLTWRMREGATLAQALEACIEDLDGFYTFVVGTQTGFAVLRDPISCKPAVMAETDSYVAFGSEYRALAVLPGIEKAHVFEPEPARVYAWERN